MALEGTWLHHNQYEIHHNLVYHCSCSCHWQKQQWQYWPYDQPIERVVENMFFLHDGISNILTFCQHGFGGTTEKCWCKWSPPCCHQFLTRTSLLPAIPDEQHWPWPEDASPNKTSFSNPHLSFKMKVTNYKMEWAMQKQWREQMQKHFSLFSSSQKIFCSTLLCIS